MKNITRFFSASRTGRRIEKNPTREMRAVKNTQAYAMKEMRENIFPHELCFPAKLVNNFAT